MCRDIANPDTKAPGAAPAAEQNITEHVDAAQTNTAQTNTAQTSTAQFGHCEQNSQANPAQTRSLPWTYGALFAGSVVESSIMPWPLEFPLTAVMLRGRAHVFPAAIVVWAGSLLGCAIAFALGLVAYDLTAGAFSAWLSWFDRVATARSDVSAHASWAVFAAMFTPAPQAASFAAGALGVSFWAFFLACSIGRAIRFASMAVLVFIFGEQILTWWTARSPGFRTSFIILAVCLFVALIIRQIVG